MKNFRSQILLFLFLTFILLCHCTTDHNSSDGSEITFLEQPANNPTHEWDEIFTNTRTIEFQLPQENDHIIGEFNDMAFNQELDLIIPDHHNNKLLFFDKQGNFQQSVGGEGEGPGEFELINGLFVKDDTLFVSDLSQQRISVFHTQSRDLQEIIPFESYYSDFYIDDSHIITYNYDDTEDEMIRIYSREGEKLSSGFRFENDAHRVFLNRFNLGSITPASDNDSFFVLYPGSYGIYELNPEPEVIHSLETEDYNQFRQEPPSFPGNLNPYEWDQEHIEYAKNFKMNARHFLLEPDIHLILYFEFRQQGTAPHWLNIYREDGSVIAEGVGVPSGHQVVGTKSDQLILRTFIDDQDDVPKLEVYQLSQ